MKSVLLKVTIYADLDDDLISDSIKYDFEMIKKDNVVDGSGSLVQALTDIKEYVRKRLGSVRKEQNN